MVYHKTLWRYCGAWFKHYSYPRLYTAYSVLLHMLHICFCTSQWIYLRNVHTMIEAIDILTVGSIFTLVSIKSILFIWHKPMCVEILELLRTIDDQVDGKSVAEQCIVKKTVRQMRIIGILIAVCAFNAAFIHLIMTQVLSGQRLLVFPATMPFDWQHNNYWFCATNVYQMVFALYSTAILATLDIIGPHIYMMLEAYLRILDNRMKSIGWRQSVFGVGRLEMSLEEKRKWNTEAEVELVDCVKLHKQCLR